MACAPEHRIVLVGGGHTHVQVMRALADRPEPGVRLTLVTDRRLTPYSGMLPGHLAGVYRFDEMHIDLARLAAGTGTELVEASATGLDAKRRVLFTHGGEPLPYDTLSLNVGITPDLQQIAGAERHGLAAVCEGSIFAVGDCATVADDPRPRAGVFAVRQGPALERNLRRRARREALLPHHAQWDYLTILMTGDGSAIAGRGSWLALEGRLVWRWKDWIDRRFMRRFQL